jgi:hypothetical protein
VALASIISDSVWFLLNTSLKNIIKGAVPDNTLYVLSGTAPKLIIFSVCDDHHRRSVDVMAL